MGQRKELFDHSLPLANQINKVLPDGSRVMNFRALAALAVLPTICFAQSPGARLAATPPKVLESSPDTLLQEGVSPKG